MPGINLTALLVAGAVVTAADRVVLLDSAKGANSLNALVGQAEQNSSGLINRIQSEPVRKALESYNHIADEELSYSGFTFTFSAAADGQKVRPVLQVAYNGEAPRAERIYLMFVLCGAEMKDDGHWGASCFAPPRPVKLEGPFNKGEIRAVVPSKPLSHAYSKTPYVLLPHVNINELGNTRLDVGTVMGYGIEIHPRK